MGVLSELGRIIETFSDGERHAVDLALEILSMTPKPTSKQVVAYLRRWRIDELGNPAKQSTWSVEEIPRAIAASLDNNLTKNPGTPDGEILEALGILAGFILDREDPGCEA
jgi:hypothetical protein